MCSVDLEKTFHRVPRKVVEWAMRKKGIPEALVKALMRQYIGAKTIVKVGTHLSEEFEVTVEVNRGSVFPSLFFAIVIDVVTNDIKEVELREILYAANLVLIAEYIREVHHKCYS